MLGCLKATGFVGFCPRSSNVIESKRRNNNLPCSRNALRNRTCSASETQNYNSNYNRPKLPGVADSPCHCGSYEHLNHLVGKKCLNCSLKQRQSFREKLASLPGQTRDLEDTTFSNMLQNHSKNTNFVEKMATKRVLKTRSRSVDRFPENNY